MTDYIKGQTVTLNRDGRFYTASGYDSRQFSRGTTFEVTVVRKNVITARIRHEEHYNASRQAWYSYNFDRADLLAPNGETWDAEAAKKVAAAKPKPRKLGQKPEGTLPDGTPYIGTDAPGIQWLFEDIAAYGEKSRYCSTFDQILGELGLPARPKNYTVTGKVNGMSISAVHKARSKKEATDTFNAELAKLNLTATGVAANSGY